MGQESCWTVNKTNLGPAPVDFTILGGELDTNPVLLLPMPLVFPRGSIV